MLGGIGAVFHQRPGVAVEVTTGGDAGPVGGQSADQLIPSALQEAESGLRGQMAGEGQAEAEAAGLVGSHGLLGGEQPLEGPPPGIGDPVDLA